MASCCLIFNFRFIFINMFTQIRKFSYQGVSGSQTFMSRDPLLRLAGEYLIYRDT